MVNGEKIGVFQDAGDKNWYKKLPNNVKIFNSLKELENSDSKGFLIITDKILEGKFLSESVVYRPPSLVIGIGLHGAYFSIILMPAGDDAQFGTEGFHHLPGHRFEDGFQSKIRGNHRHRFKE